MCIQREHSEEQLLPFWAVTIVNQVAVKAHMFRNKPDHPTHVKPVSLSVQVEQECSTSAWTWACTGGGREHSGNIPNCSAEIYHKSVLVKLKVTAICYCPRTLIAYVYCNWAVPMLLRRGGICCYSLLLCTLGLASSLQSSCLRLPCPSISNVGIVRVCVKSYCIMIMDFKNKR